MAEGTRTHGLSNANPQCAGLSMSPSAAARAWQRRLLHPGRSDRDFPLGLKTDAIDSCPGRFGNSILNAFLPIAEALKVNVPLASSL